MKFKIPVYAISIFLIILFQSTLVDYIKVFGIKPNLMIVFTVTVALLMGNTEGAIVGFMTGLSHDIISGKVIGFYSLLGLYLGLITGSLNKRLYRENIFVVIFFTFVSSIIYESIVCLVAVTLRNWSDMLMLFRTIILPEAIYNSAAAIFIFIVVLKINYKYQSIMNSQRKY